MQPENVIPPREKRGNEPERSVEPDVTPRREGGGDSFAESSPNDSSLDEKVIVNEQRSDKTVNVPSQTAANTSEGSSFDDDIVDQIQDSDE